MLADELTTVVRQAINVVRASYEIWYSWDNRATLSRVSCDSREIVVRQSCDVCLIEMVYNDTHDNVFNRTTVVRHFHDSHKTVTRQKIVEQKKLHVQFSSHDTRQRHDAQNIVRLSCDCRTTTPDDPQFDQISCRGLNQQICRNETFGEEKYI